MSNLFVGRNGTRFTFSGADFPVNGVNCYFLAYASEATRRIAMKTAKQMNANVIRSWAFKDLAAPNGDVAFQYQENAVVKIDDGPNGLARLDSVIQIADELGLKLILPLVNHWKDFGGTPMYLRWLGLDPNTPQLFYESLEARLAYRNWMQHVLTRKNTLTGRLYAEEPSILAWELTNEARCDGQRDVLLDWTHEMAAFAKQLDPNHMVALGDEGFIRHHSFFQHSHDELYSGVHGTDFQAILEIPEIDFGGFHFYPQDWKRTLEFGDQWVTDHAEIGRRVGKPTLMEEYGLKIGAGTSVPDAATRNQWFAQWLKTVKDSGTAGAMLWMLGCKEPDTAGYIDGYEVYAPDEVPALAKVASA